MKFETSCPNCSTPLTIPQIIATPLPQLLRCKGWRRGLIVKGWTWPCISIALILGGIFGAAIAILRIPPVKSLVLFAVYILLIEIVVSLAIINKGKLEVKEK